MALTTTSNFSGKAAGFYISAALKEAKSLDYLTTIENIKFKSNIQKMAATGMVANATCDFNEAGTLAMTENVLEPKLLMINTDLCKKDLLDSWEALQMRAGAGAPPPASFDDYVISYLSGIIADGVESDIWAGDNGAGRFLGFLDAAAGSIATGAGIVTSTASAAYTAGNIIANLQQLVTDWTASASAVNTMYKEDTYIYMNKKTYSFYISAVSALNAFPFNNMGEYTPVFEGHNIAVCPGMVDNQLVCAEKSNLFFGTDLLSDHTRIQLLDMSSLDGSDNLRVVARYSAGVQTGINADIVRQS
jgi:hypothetical protein|tara:strand:+ start:107 stop:1018 length:912 start_codon:yes stop_codon:yes gene_type:complete